ncbi:exosome complex component RRP43-like isoform X1 [Contarinia nasturtii]|uniref:exosome complex component RRP43-like isoform X1 n=1 Tax=Contarinia nasturtii TaxID=265458 RepID=UPI0012D44E01|nr:exosome complex component RRP43-like isoform X1 [Contarinia nasturtii]
MEEQYKIIHPIKYYRNYIAHDIRPDGREFEAFRPIRINVKSIGTADGSAIVKLGNTTVICGIKAELSAPTVEEPEKGYLIPNIDLTPLCSPKYRSNNTNDDAQVLTCNLNNLIKEANWIDLKNLCIAKERLVWTLYCDISCVDYDGSILDASVVAICAALRSLTLPKVQYDDETNNYTVHKIDRSPLKLSEMCPVCTTAMIFDEKTVFADPDAEEEELATSLITIVTCDGEMCLVLKPGGVSISDRQFEACLKLALNREKSICKLISSIVEEN